MCSRLGIQGKHLHSKLDKSLYKVKNIRVNELKLKNGTSSSSNKEGWVDSTGEFYSTYYTSGRHCISHSQFVKEW